MKKYKLIGKTRHMQDLFLTGDDGRFRQSKIIQGKIIEVTENQLNFLTERLEARGAIQLLELEEEVPEPAPIVLDEPAPEPEEELVVEEETPAVNVEEFESEEAVAPAPKKRRRRKKKSEE